jgi:single-strand DNA-binding protein
LNKVMLIGNLGADPELRRTASGQAVATFSVATNRAWTGQDGTQREETEWHKIVAWNSGRYPLAEICQQYLHKGSKVYIEGRIQTRSWDDQKSGQKRYMTEVVANQMIMLDPAGSGAGRGEAGARVPSNDRQGGDGDRDVEWPESDDFDDDLPF